MLDLVRSLSGLSSIRPKIDLRQMAIDSIANPIGLAQYFSQLNKNPAPTYRFQPTAQPPFKCVAELGDGRQVEGVAHRRTDAKSGAARLLLKLYSISDTEQEALSNGGTTLPALTVHLSSTTGE